MAFVPYEHFTIDTSLPFDKAVDRIAQLIEPKRSFRNPFSREHKEFEGSVTPQDFKISRIIHYRNSFLPIINGQFVKTPLGTRLTVRMTLHPFVIAFLILWSGVIGLSFVMALRESDGKAAAPFMLGMLAFVYLLTTGAFKWEARKARRRFMQLFAGQA
ncbi:MAG TPA: hypothetical protein VF658_14285 [Pyrinomonadaceae bacterium]|jgi:hypothetical protein